MEREDASFHIQLMQRGGDLPELGEVGELIGIAGNFHEGDRRSRLFEFRGNREAGFARCEREGNERRWHVEVVEGTGHRVLATDGGEAERVLRLIGTEQRGERQAPAGCIVAKFREIFLEREPDVGESRASGDRLADGLGDGVERAVEGRPRGNLRVEAPAHVGANVGVAF